MIKKLYILVHNLLWLYSIDLVGLRTCECCGPLRTKCVKRIHVSHIKVRLSTRLFAHEYREVVAFRKKCHSRRALVAYEFRGFRDYAANSSGYP